MLHDEEPSKFLLPYIHRAREIERYEPRIAYYCRLYALERGLKIPPSERTKTTDQILLSLMNQLEKDKDSAKWGVEDNEYVGNFAMTVFMKADKQDRNGKANVDTAKSFYAASLFIEVLHVFGGLQSGFEQKQKYAAWRAAEIWKSLNRKRNSMSHSVKTNEDDSSERKISEDDESAERISDVQVSTTFDAVGLSCEVETDTLEDEYPSKEHVVSSFIPHHLSTGETDRSSHISDDNTVKSRSHFRQENDADLDHTKYDGIKQFHKDDLDATNVENPSYHPSPTIVAEAHKVAKMAVSSLAFDDVPSAISFLKEALDLLTIP